MEFAEEGGEGPTPYEVLLHAAMIGDSTRFTRQDSVEESLAGPAAAARLAAAGAPVREGRRGGPTAADELVAEHGGWHGPWVASMSDKPGHPRPRRRARRRRRRSRRSPTTRSSPTATPARWSRPTGRSTGSACRASTRRASSARCSTAEAGTFRLGPFGINVPTRADLRARDEHPAARPGTRPRGWIVVRDALTMGPSHGEDEVTPHTRPPADDDGDHLLVRTVLCLDGHGRGRAGLRAGLRLRAHARRVDAGRRRPPYGRRDRRRARRSGCRPTWRSASRATGCAPATC